MNGKHVALLVGGSSRERLISQMSGKSVHEALLQLGYQVTVIDPGKDLTDKLISLKPDLVFNCLHGTFGEDGAIPGLLELLKIPYTHSGVCASAVAMNKVLTKKIALASGITTPIYLEIKAAGLFRILEQNLDPMPKPYVIKAVQQGSTIGVYLILDDNSVKPTTQDWLFGDMVLIEEYIPGQELSAVVFNNRALGVLELRPQYNFYDYYAKYSDGVTEHIYPAAVPEEVYQAVMRMSEDIHQAIGCRTLSRIDFRYNNKLAGKAGIFFLEINTHPGFTNLSIVQDIASRHDISFEQIVEQLIKDAKCEIVM